jgi:hypothetical protein
MNSYVDISSLSSLLNESRESTERRVETFQQKPLPGSSTVVRQGNKEAPVYISPTVEVTKEKIKQDSDSNKKIWEDSDILSEDAFLAVKDDRPAPRYEVSYKQSIGTEDTFLGMSEKTPLSSDCTHLVIKIHFPLSSSASELELKVTKNSVLAASKSLRLFTYLPVDVDENNGKAQFDKKKELLTITLPIISNF